MSGWARWRRRGRRTTVLAAVAFQAAFAASVGGQTGATVDVAVVYTPAARAAAGGAAEIATAIDLMVAETNQRRGHSLYIGGAFGLSAYASGWIFAHELGHNMGLRHDRYTVHHREDGAADSSGAYGYVNQRAFAAGAPASSRWATVMAFDTQCVDAGFRCRELSRFSNPRQLYEGDPLGVDVCGGRASGVTGPADAVAVLDDRMPVVAGWRDRGDPLTWGVSSSAPGVVTVTAVGARLTLTAVRPGAATVRVTATDPGGLSASQSFAVTVRRPFTDDPIRPGATPIRAVHFTELRTRIDGLRQAAGLAAFAWTDSVLRAGATRVRLVHLLELRQALGAAYRAAGRTPPRWTDAAPVAGTTAIRAAHLTELRTAVSALE